MENALSKKLIFIINGKGGSGKDTVCDIISKRFKTKTISAITPIKEMAKLGGWNGQKDDKSRKMLSDLKMLFVEYNDLPFNYILSEINKFKDSNNQILFIHIREIEEIEKVLNSTDEKIYTLLVKRTDEDFIEREYGNKSDDLVENYNYDFYYIGNNANKKELEISFNKYFDQVILKNI